MNLKKTQFEALTLQIAVFILFVILFLSVFYCVYIEDWADRIKNVSLAMITKKVDDTLTVPICYSKTSTC